MPLLTTIGYNFAATVTWRYPRILFCFDLESQISPLLSATSPKLQSLTVSNADPADLIFEQLSDNLHTLRVLALRDPLRGYEQSRDEWFPLSPLGDLDAFNLVEKTSRLLNLVELAMTLHNPPSPDLINAIAHACPQLYTLELGESMFETHTRLYPYSRVSQVIYMCPYWLLTG